MKKIGCFPLYPPLELFHSMGLLPVVLWGLRGNVTALDHSDRHLQTYTCSVARHLMQYVLSDTGMRFDGFFMYNACDTLRNLPEIIREGLNRKSVRRSLFRMHIPMAPAGQTRSEDYFKHDVQALVNELEHFTGQAFSSARFEKSVELYNTMRGLAGEVAYLAGEGKISFNDYADIMKACNHLSVEDQIAALESAVGDARNQAGKNGRRVFVSGILPPPASVVDAIEKAGMIIAGDDIAMLSRAYSGHHPPHGDPGEYYLDFYRDHYPCPTLLYSSSRRFKALLVSIRRKQAEGVILVGEKFCEYEYFEFPDLEKRLKQEGLETLFIEITVEDDDHTEAHRTRIEAFAEQHLFKALTGGVNHDIAQ